MRASAAAANVISNEQPCRVKLRIWRYSPSEDVPGTSGALKGKGKEKASSSKHHQSSAPHTELAMSCTKMTRWRGLIATSASYFGAQIGGVHRTVRVLGRLEALA